jgi:hypothetical protein
MDCKQKLFEPYSTGHLIEARGFLGCMFGFLQLLSVNHTEQAVPFLEESFYP